MTKINTDKNKNNLDDGESIISNSELIEMSLELRCLFERLKDLEFDLRTVKQKMCDAIISFSPSEASDEN